MTGKVLSGMSLCVMVKGGGDLGTGVAWRLHRCGFQVLVTDIAQPTAIRRTVAFASAIYDGYVTIENVVGRLVETQDEVSRCWSARQVAVMVDQESRILPQLKPDVLVDAIVAKHNLGTKIDDAPVVIALGPGFTVVEDCHAVVETNRGHNLGRVIWQGSAEPNTGIPGTVDGENSRRILKAPADGDFHPVRQIGDMVRAGEIVAYVDNLPIQAQLDGIVRGLLHADLSIKTGMKVGDIDQRAVFSHCYTISDKSLAVAGGVLEAILTMRNLLDNLQGYR